MAPPPAPPVPEGAPADLPVSGYRISAADEIDVPVTVITNDQSPGVSGAFDISQRRFGIEPFSVMGGALAVAATLELRFSIIARRWRGRGASLSDRG